MVKDDKIARIGIECSLSYRVGSTEQEGFCEGFTIEVAETR